MARAATMARLVNRRVFPVRPRLLSIQPPPGCRARSGQGSAPAGPVLVGSARSRPLAVRLQLHPRRAGGQGDLVASGIVVPRDVRPGGAGPGPPDARAEAADDGRTGPDRL